MTYLVQAILLSSGRTLLRVPVSVPLATVFLAPGTEPGTQWGGWPISIVLLLSSLIHSVQN